jgi:hypothetical protein
VTIATLASEGIASVVFIVPSVPPCSPPRRIRQCLWAEVWLSEPVMHRPLNCCRRPLSRWTNLSSRSEHSDALEGLLPIAR